MASFFIYFTYVLTYVIVSNVSTF